METRFEIGDRSVQSFYVMCDVPTPANQAMHFAEPRGDFHVSIEWKAPTVLLQQNAMTSVGSPPEAGAVSRSAHLITPQSTSSSHYFWLSSRNRAVPDEITARTKEMVRNAFLMEDEPMILAVQNNMAGREFFSLKPLYLDIDNAATRCRRILEKLIVQENAAASRITDLQSA